MAKKKVRRRTAAGGFVRNIGWKRTAGGYTTHKFHLGSNEATAEVANLRLEQLWAQATKRWERENSNELSPTDRPVWDAVTLAIAEAVRKAQPVAKVPLPVPYSAMVPDSPIVGDWLEAAGGSGNEPSPYSAPQERDRPGGKRCPCRDLLHP